MTSRQKDLFASVQLLLADGPRHTHAIAVALGHYQSYESHLRDRLFRLEERGLIRSTRTTRGRFWALASAEGGAL